MASPTGEEGESVGGAVRGKREGLSRGELLGGDRALWGLLQGRTQGLSRVSAGVSGLLRVIPGERRGGYCREKRKGLLRLLQGEEVGVCGAPQQEGECL